ncbi:MAG: hypothetical protein FJ308_06655, partial [Planctomycetes bacterium]|nr:hypothetical protein [Planctomycetota bacterium]
MTANPNSPTRVQTQSDPERRVPDFWKSIFDGPDSAFPLDDQKGGVDLTASIESDAMPKVQKCVIRDESADLPLERGMLKEIANPESDTFAMKVFRSARRDTSPSATADTVLVAMMQNRDRVWLAFPITNFSGSSPFPRNLASPSTNSADPSKSLEPVLSGRTNSEEQEPTPIRGPSISSMVPRESWNTMLPTVAFLPDDSPLRSLHVKELDDLEEALEQSKLLISDNTLWHAIPSTSWTTAAMPLAETHQPPLSILQDWQRQFRDIASRTSTPKNTSTPRNPDETSSAGTNISSTTNPACENTSQPTSLLAPHPGPFPDSPCHYLLSIHGLIFPIRALHEELLRSLAIPMEQPQIDWLLAWGEQPVEIEWPEFHAPTEYLPTAGPSKSTSKASSTTLAKTPTSRPRPSITKNLQKLNRPRWVFAAVAATLAAVSLLFYSRVFTATPKTKVSAPATGKDELASSSQFELTSRNNSHTESSELTASELTDIAERSEIHSAEITATPALAPSDASLGFSPDQIVSQSLAKSAISNNSSSAIRGLDQPTSELVHPDPLAFENKTMGGELAGDAAPSSTRANDAPNSILPAGAAGVAPLAVDEELVINPALEDRRFAIPATKAFQRVELKTGRQTDKVETESMSKSSPCWAQLKLSDEAIDELEIQPSEFEIALSDAPAKWRLTLDDVVPELHVYLLTKPGRRWFLMVQVGVYFPGDTQPTPLGRDDAANVVLKLQAHQQWLSQSIDVLRNSPFPKRVPGRPDVFTQTRDLQSQQKETKKALEQW